ncbi:RDD family protein [bacterium]|nr:RDD family protein [bacterium]
MMNRIEKSFLESTSWVYAPLYQRFVAFVIDVMLIYGMAISFSLGFGVINDRAWIMLFAAFFSWIYLTFFYYKGKGQTVGGKAFGIKVTTIDGSELGFWKALLRSVLISALISPFGFVSVLTLSFILFSVLSLNLKPTKQRQQTFWDAATKSCVIKGGVKLKWNEW